jgi:hypothetical protein
MNTKIIKVGEKEYTLQKIAVREWLKLRKRCKVEGELDDEMFYAEILEHIVVAPKVSIDDFEEIEDLEEVMKEAITFQCKKQDKITVPKRSGK